MLIHIWIQHGIEFFQKRFIRIIRDPIIIKEKIVGLVPFAIAIILPTLFNVKSKYYFLGTMIGITPSIFIMTSLGSGLENIISLNSEMPSLIKIITSEEIYIPIIGFIIFFILVFFIKSKFTAK